MAHGSSGHGGGHGAGGALKEFFLALGLDADAASFASAEAAVHALEKGLELAYEAAEKLADAFVESVISTAEYSHATEHASEVTGLATDTIQELGAVSRIAGTGADSMQTAFVRLARSMAEARDGGAEAQQAFARLGVHVTDATGKLRPVEDVMNDVSDGLARATGSADQQALAMKVLGRGGAETLSVFGKGAVVLKAYREEVRELGGVMSSEEIERGAEFAKGLSKLQIAAEGLVHTFAGPLIEALNPLLDQIIEWYKVNGELIRTDVKAFATGVAKAITVLASGVKSLVQFLGMLVDNFWRVVAVLRVIAVVALPVLLVLLSQYIWSVILAAGVTIEWLIDILATAAALIFMGAEAVAAAVSAAAAWLAAASPLLLIIAILGLVYLAFDDLYGFLTGKDSLIGAVLNRYADQVVGFWETLKAIVLPWWFTAIFGPNAVDKFGVAVGDFIAGGGDTTGHVAGGAISPGAAASFQSSAGGVSVTAPLNVTIHAPVGTSGEDIAEQIQQLQQAHVQQLLREAKANKKG
jgi:hypothetical protein